MTRNLQASLLPLAASAALPLGCIATNLLPNEHHCAQQTGDEWCADLHPDGSRPYCLRGFCEAEGEPDPRPLDGCVTTRPLDDACYSPCGHGSSLPDDASCLEPASTGPSTTEPEPSTGPEPQPICGDTIVDLDEACDDGEHNGEHGHCALDCQGPTVWCGDGQPQIDEACDDGNSVVGDGCNPDCRGSGSVVWERQLLFNGFLSGVDVASDGAIYAAGGIEDAPSRAWAARLDEDAGTVDWSYTVETTAGNALSDVFFAVEVIDDGLITFAGRHDTQAHVVILDEAGSFLEDATDPWSTYVDSIADIGDGYLAKHGEIAVRYDYALSEKWSAPVGAGLAYRPGDNVALAAPKIGASFRRFTLEGTAFEPVTFWLPMSFVAQSQLVAWTKRGDVVVAGQLSGWGAEDAFVIQSSAGGDLRWLYGAETLNDQLRHAACLTIDGDDAVIIGGYASLLSSEHHFLMKLSAAGELLWTRSLEFAASTGRIYGCATNAANEIIAVGHADGQLWLAKVTP